MKYIPLLALALCVATSSHADENASRAQTEFDKQVQQCIEAQNSWDQGYCDQGDKCAMDCNQSAYRKYDAELNQVYKKLRAKLREPNEEAKLVASERAWIKQRDHHCVDDFVSSTEIDMETTDTDTRQQIANGEEECLAEETWKRLQILNQRLAKRSRQP